MLADAVATPPPALHATVIGRSVRGRPLRVVKIGPDDALIKVLVVGCVHGTERAGLAVTRALRRVHAPLATQELVLDEANPDGCAAGTRGNAHGVDLNRNFPWGWRRRSGIFASGPRAASEPETRAIMAYILKERPQDHDLVPPAHEPGRRHPRLRAAHHQGLRVVRGTCAPTASRRCPAPRRAGRTTGWPGRRAFVVELPAGPMTALAVRRHIRAIVAATEVVGVPSKR